MTGPVVDPDDVEDLPSEGNPNGEVGSVLSGKLFAAVVLTALGTILLLIVLVIVVGLLRNNLDTTGVATVLSTLFSGIVVGTLVRRKDPPS